MAVAKRAPAATQGPVSDSVQDADLNKSETTADREHPESRACNVRGKLREIKKRYALAAKRANPTAQKRKPSLAVLRQAELERFYRDRFGKFIPESDEGRAALRFICNYVAQLHGNPVHSVMGWIRARAPWMAVDEAKEIGERCALHTYWHDPDELAWLIGLHMAVRSRLEIRTIGAIDFPLRKRRAFRKTKDRERKAEQRRRDGAKPHVESFSRTKPWLAFGWSRAKWYRRGKPTPADSRETDSSTIVSILHPIADEVVSPKKNSGRAQAAPPLKGSLSGSQRATPSPVETPMASGLLYGSQEKEETGGDMLGDVWAAAYRAAFAASTASQRRAA